MPSKRQAKTTSASKGKTLPPSALPSHAAKKLLLDVDNLTVVLGEQRVVDDVSFCVHSGEFIGLIGPNGAGKTTLLRAILGLIGTYRGTLDKKVHKIGYVPQRGFMQGAQVPLSVMEVVGLGASGKTDAVLKALKDVNMEEYAGRRLSELSGGQQQRVLIAKALAAKPELLILDEPTTGIDAESQTEFYKILTDLQKKGITVMMVSHDVDAVVNQVSRIICMNHIILYDGPAEHFEIDRYLPKFYATRHKALHHHHGGEHA